MIDRIEVSRALAKAIAYKWAGKDAEATSWAVQLVRLLGEAEILAPSYAARSTPSGDSHGNRYPGTASTRREN